MSFKENLHLLFGIYAIWILVLITVNMSFYGSVHTKKLDYDKIQKYSTVLFWLNFLTLFIFILFTAYSGFNDNVKFKYSFV